MRATPVQTLAMSAPDITELEVAAVTDVLRSGQLSLGPQLDAFERAFARHVGAAHAIGVSSGTCGLHLAVLAADIGPGDLVVTTPFSFVASSNCLLYAGAEPLFVDVELATGNIDVSLVDQALAEAAAAGRPAKAVLPVHVFGQPADMDAIADIARRHGVVVIEDACEAIGAEYKGRPAGALGDVAVFGFYPNKQLTTGEGGMVVTDRDDWAARIRSQRNQGRDVMDAWLRHDRLGFNYRMNELSAALGVAQLSRIGQLLGARARVARWYDERLDGVDGLDVPRMAATTTCASWFAYVVRLGVWVDRDVVMSGLAARGIPSRTYFTPLHLQPFYVERFGFAPGDFPVAETLGRTSLALPFSGLMTEGDVDRVCAELRRLIAASPVATSISMTATA